ncbi:MAG: TM2 domain-containing protein [Ruminococcus sp.]|nr:TM2 domain-containing protein [Ruminococcus sp.]MBP3796647.1 TM2 domain-containing protein [Ruminococcus sp.]MBQ1432736.1 TM2 domain-containing protein [Ruminococcus sp.]
MIFVMQKFKDKNKNEAGVLAIVFGGLGGHKFYLGKYGQGLVCVAFCWTLIPALLGIIQGIHYLTETQQQFEEELRPAVKQKKAKKK